MTNFYNKKMLEQGRARRAKFYRLHVTKKLSATELALRFGISKQRMSFMLRQAKKEATA